MAKQLKTLCESRDGFKVKFRTELDAKLYILKKQQQQSAGRKRKGVASKDVPIRAYFHDRYNKGNPGCGYWHVTSQEQKTPAKPRTETRSRKGAAKKRAS